MRGFGPPKTYASKLLLYSYAVPVLICVDTDLGPDNLAWRRWMGLELVKSAALKAESVTFSSVWMSGRLSEASVRPTSSP